MVHIGYLTNSSNLTEASIRDQFAVRKYDEAAKEDAFLAEMDAAALADLLIVSQVEVTVGGELAVSVSEAAGTKCPRCWMHSQQANAEGLCPRCAAVCKALNVVFE